MVDDLRRQRIGPPAQGHLGINPNRCSKVTKGGKQAADGIGSFATRHRRCIIGDGQIGFAETVDC